MQERLKDVMKIVEEKNPLLVQEVYKGSTAGITGSKVKMMNMSVSKAGEF
jgi:hypothetical protein